jgi:hypothetical protein
MKRFGVAGRCPAGRVVAASDLDFEERGKAGLSWARGESVCAFWDELAEEGLGRLVGFEPTTSAATERRSATEL